MKKFIPLIVCILVVIAVYTRLYGFTRTIGDWHSWRQSDTASVARNFIKFGFDPLRPRFDDLSNIPSGKDNPMGWRMVEFPIYQSAGYWVWRAFPGVPIELVLRLVTIAASVGTLIILYLLIEHAVGTFAALAGAFVFAVLPYGVYYGRSILPDPFMVFWAVLSVYLALKATDRKDEAGKAVWMFVLLAGVSGALSLLVKPMAIFLLLPVPYLFFRRFGISLNLFIGLLVYWIIGLLPLAVWRQWILQYPEGIAVYTWLFNEGGIRFKGAWFYWLFARRLAELMLGYWGLVPLSLGILIAPAKREGWIFRCWIIGAIAYMVVIARGNVQHDYYQILLVPVVSVYVGKGFAFLLQNKVFSRAVSFQLSVISLLFMLAFSWYTIRSYYWINHPEIIEAGRAADKLLPKDAKVIAPYGGDTTFLYQTNRQGWPIGFEIDKKRLMGATYYVTVNPSDNDFETRDLAKQFTVLVRNEKFAIIDLTKPKL